MAVDILILVLVAIRLVVGVSLIRAAQRNNERNLFWLAGVFFINGIFNVFLTRRLVPNPLLGFGGILLAQLALSCSSTTPFIVTGAARSACSWGSVCSAVWHWLSW
jgi:hypothetical protein